MIVVADERKQVDVLGKFHLPVEILQFEWRATSARLAEICPGDVALRGVREPVSNRQRGLHNRLRLRWSNRRPTSLESEILSIAGVVEVGLFCDMCDAVILAERTGLRQLKIKNGGRLG